MTAGKNTRPEAVALSLERRARDGTLHTEPAEAAAVIRALIAERDKYRSWAADALSFMAKAIAAHSSLSSRRIIDPRHYDMMVEAGCDMDDLVRREP